MFDAIKMLPTARCQAPFTKKPSFPSTTLIRLYKLLKNNSQYWLTNQNNHPPCSSWILWFVNQIVQN